MVAHLSPHPQPWLGLVASPFTGVPPWRHHGERCRERLREELLLATRAATHAATRGAMMREGNI